MRPIHRILRSRASWPVRGFTAALALVLLPATTLLGFSNSASAQPSSWGTVTLPTSIPDDNTHFAMDGNGNVYTVPYSGGVSRYSLATGTTVVLDGGASFSRDYFAVDHSGNTYINTGSGSIVKVDAGGFASNYGTVPSNGPLAVDPAGNVWAASFSGGNSTIYKFTSGIMSEVGVFTSLSATSMSVAPNGTLYAVEYANTGSLVAMSPMGTTSVIDNTTLNRPEGVAVDGANNVYVAAESNSTIYEYPAGGPRTDIGGISGCPEALAVDGSTLYAYDECYSGNALGTYTVTPLSYAGAPVVQLNVQSALVAQQSSFSQGITASWYGVPGALSYTCTLMYGFSLPSTFKVTTPTTSCYFGNLSLNSQYGIQVVANFGSATSPAVMMFAPAVKTPSSSIVCARGHARKRVTGINPTCPVGYHKV